MERKEIKSTVKDLDLDPWICDTKVPLIQIHETKFQPKRRKIKSRAIKTHINCVNY